MLFLLLMLIIGYFIVQDLAIIDNQSNNSERMRSSEISVDMESDHAIVRENGKVKRKLNRRFRGVNRIYANGQTAGQCGTPHKDDGDLTFLYYPLTEWEIKWQGHLIFLDEKDEGDKIVFYKPNRAVLFDGKQRHYADAPSRFYNDLRISLAYKLISWN